MRTLRPLRAAVIASALAACAGPRPLPRTAVAASASPSSARPSPDLTALESLRSQLAAGDREALAAVTLALAHANGARDLEGDQATDERVSRVLTLAQYDDTAALLAETTCGNVLLTTVHWDGAKWIGVERVSLVGGMQPGRCATTELRGESLALSSDARREFAVVWGTEDVTGESVQGPFLSVYQLEPGGRLQPLLVAEPFGSTSDDTGASTVGEFAVVDDIPPPRDLHVAIRPGHLGPGGAPAPEIVRRRYALRGNRLVMVQETTEPAE